MSMNKNDPMLKAACELLNLSLPAPLEGSGTKKLLWMDRPTLASTVRVAQMRRDRNASPEELFDPELQKQLVRILRLMLRNNYMLVGEIPINKLISIATGARFPRKRG